MEFGTRLRELRVASGATLADVAEVTGISVPMLSRIENGQRLPSPRFTEALARYFGMPAEDLLADVVSDSMRTRYGMEPDSYRGAMEDDARWEPARRRMRAIGEQLRRDASEFEVRSVAAPAGEPTAPPGPPPSPRAEGDRVAGIAPTSPRDPAEREKRRAAEALFFHEEARAIEDSSIEERAIGGRAIEEHSIDDRAIGAMPDQEAAHRLESRREPRDRAVRAYAERPVAELFGGAAPGSPAGDAALAQRSALRRLREMLRSRDPSVRDAALHAAADLAADPLELLREAAASADPDTRDAARRLLDRLGR